LPYNNRVLVIDDDQTILDTFVAILGNSQYAVGGNMASLSTLLSEDGHSVLKKEKRIFAVDSALQGEEGFQKVRDALEQGKPYSVVFTDVRMPPGWDGVKTAKAIRAIDETIQIIVVTAFSDAPLSDIVKQVGFTDRLLYLKKPFDDEEILQLADSLSMRWNLEVKVRNLMSILENMLDSFFALKMATYSDQELSPFLREMLLQVSRFLDTPDVFLARLENQKIILKIGLGRFADGLTESPEFLKLLDSIIENQRFETVLRIDQYVVMPIYCHRTKSIIVGLLSEREIEGIENLLAVLAKDMAKVYETVYALSELRFDVAAKDKRIKELEATLRARDTAEEE